MTPQRQLELERGTGQITDEEYRQGWHWCYDWDGMLVGPGMHEMKACTCPLPKTEKKNEND